jgi:hypothetical protein
MRVDREREKISKSGIDNLLARRESLDKVMSQDDKLEDPEDRDA